MQKQAPTLGRLLVMAGFALSCFGLLLFLWLAFGGSIPLAPKGYRFRVSFSQATQLANEADVRISGVNVGKVVALKTSPSGRTMATVQMDTPYAPVDRDTEAILRQKTLLGETYVELTPGHRSAGTLPENAILPDSHVAPTVQLDDILRTFDPATRQAFQTWMQDSATSLSGRGLDLNDAFGNLAPTAEGATTLLRLLNAQAPNVRTLVNQTGVVFNALSARDHQLSSLITNSNRVFATTARRDRDLQALFRALPTFESQSRLTVDRLSAFARNTNPLVNHLHPAARQLSPTLVDLARLAPDLKGFFHDLNPLITISRTGLPATSAFLDELHPLLGELDTPLRQLNPIVRFVGYYRDELRAFLSNVPASTQACQVESGSNGACVHYLRTSNPINPENFAVYPRRIGSNRTNAYQLPHAVTGKGYGTLQFPPDGVGHLLSFETRQCGRGDPTVVIPPPGTPVNQIPGALVNNIVNFAFGATGGISVAGHAASTIPAPPCQEQPTFSGVNGQNLKYPHVTADSSGHVRSR